MRSSAAGGLAGVVAAAAEEARRARLGAGLDASGRAGRLRLRDMLSRLQIDGPGTESGRVALAT